MAENSWCKKKSLLVLQRTGSPMVVAKPKNYAANRRRAIAPSPSNPVPSKSKDDGSGVGCGLDPASSEPLHGVVETSRLVLPCLSTVVSTSKPMISVPADKALGVEKLIGPLKAPKFTRNTSYPPAEALNEFEEPKLCWLSGKPKKSPTVDAGLPVHSPSLVPKPMAGSPTGTRNARYAVPPLYLPLLSNSVKLGIELVVVIIPPFTHTVAPVHAKCRGSAFAGFAPTKINAAAAANQSIFFNFAPHSTRFATVAVQSGGQCRHTASPKFVTT